jgi:hypothetical protein
LEILPLAPKNLTALAFLLASRIMNSRSSIGV